MYLVLSPLPLFGYLITVNGGWEGFFSLSRSLFRFFYMSLFVIFIHYSYFFYPFYLSFFCRLIWEAVGEIVRLFGFFI